MYADQFKTCPARSLRCHVPISAEIRLAILNDLINGLTIKSLRCWKRFHPEAIIVSTYSNQSIAQSTVTSSHKHIFSFYRLYPCISHQLMQLLISTHLTHLAFTFAKPPWTAMTVMIGHCQLRSAWLQVIRLFDCDLSTLNGKKSRSFFPLMCTRLASVKVCHGLVSRTRLLLTKVGFRVMTFGTNRCKK